MNKAEFLHTLNDARTQWDTALSEAQARGEAFMLSPVVGGDGWSLKDLIAHSTWYEREIMQMLAMHSMPTGESDRLWSMSGSERNAILFEMYRDLPLESVLAEAAQIYNQLYAEIEKLQDADLIDPGRYEGMPDDWLPWQLLAENSYEHYLSHLPEIRAYLDT